MKISRPALLPLLSLCLALTGCGMLPREDRSGDFTLYRGFMIPKGKGWLESPEIRTDARTRVEFRTGRLPGTVDTSEAAGGTEWWSRLPDPGGKALRGRALVEAMSLPEKTPLARTVIEEKEGRGKTTALPGNRRVDEFLVRITVLTPFSPSNRLKVRFPVSDISKR